MSSLVDIENGIHNLMLILGGKDNGEDDKDTIIHQQAAVALSRGVQEKGNIFNFVNQRVIIERAMPEIVALLRLVHAVEDSDRYRQPLIEAPTVEAEEAEVEEVEVEEKPKRTTPVEDVVSYFFDKKKTFSQAQEIIRNRYYRQVFMRLGTNEKACKFLDISVPLGSKIKKKAVPKDG